MIRMRLYVANFNKKSWLNSFNNIDSFKKELVSNASAQLFPDNTLGPFTVFFKNNRIRRGNRRCDLGKTLPINVAKCYKGKIYVFWHKTFKLVRISLSRTRSQPFSYRYCRSHENAHVKETQSHRNFYRSQNVSKNAKSWEASCIWRIGSWIL